MLQVELTDDRIDVSRVLAHVASDRAGASVVFTGTTRQDTNGLTTDWLEYEAYEPLAKRELARLQEHAVLQFQAEVHAGDQWLPIACLNHAECFQRHVVS